jgi:outer membrane protein OmpA-like peptidoglycan-associated protein
MSRTKNHREIKLQAKRNVELWIYSFADMYMILSVFFIAISVIYAQKIKEKINLVEKTQIATAGRGFASVTSDLQINFAEGTSQLTDDTKAELALFLPALKSLDGSSFIEVEGYADSSRLKKSSTYSSNLDLSQKRAVTVSEWFVKNGVALSKIRTIAYGDGSTWPQQIVGTNRRVVVKIGTHRR